MGNRAFFLQQIRGSLEPSTGCTEPVAIALNAATARRETRGAFRKMILTLDPFLFKNAMGVGIPGCDGRGVALCAAIGITGGDPDAGMNVLANVTPAAAAEAKRLCDSVEIRVLPHGRRLFIQSELITQEDAVRVVTLGNHTAIVDISHSPYAPYKYSDDDDEPSEIQKYDMADFVEFANAAPLEELEFLADGLAMNRRIAAAGERFSLGRGMAGLMKQGFWDDSAVTCAKRMVASGAFARMSGVSLPVMTATGSGNQGITLFLTVDGIAQHMGISREKELRALALAALVNVFAKSYIGELSAVCACGVASGLGASVGICYMLGGNCEQMTDAVKNVLGAISGMICDGAKEGCAYKAELAAGVAADAALLAVAGQSVSEKDGILAADLHGLLKNLGYLVTRGMAETNSAIVNIMTQKQAF